MSSLEPVQVVTGVSSVLGLLALLAYLYFLQQTKSAERSVREIVGGERPYLSQQIVQILETFHDDSSRLEALKRVTEAESDDEEKLLEKVRNNVDVMRLTSTSARRSLKTAGLSTVTFAVIAAAGLGYYWLSPKDPSSRDNSLPSASSNASEVAKEKLIQALATSAQGGCAEDIMGPMLIEACEQQRARNSQLLGSLGTIVGSTFMGLQEMGNGNKAEAYRVEFERGTMIWLASVDSTGKLQVLLSDGQILPK